MMENDKEIHQAHMTDGDEPESQPADEGIVLEAGGTVQDEEARLPVRDDEGRAGFLGSDPGRPQVEGRAGVSSGRKRP